MCCLLSAVDLPSYASFKENNEENLSNIAWLFEEEEEAVDPPSSASSASGNGPFRNLRLSRDVLYSGKVLVPDYEYNSSTDTLYFKDMEEKNISNELKVTVTGPNELCVSKILKTDNGSVVIPRKFPGEKIIPKGLPNEMNERFGDRNKNFEVKQINPDVDFSDVISLGVPDSVRTFNESGKPGEPRVPIFYILEKDNA